MREPAIERAFWSVVIGLSLLAGVLAFFYEPLGLAILTSVVCLVSIGMAVGCILMA